MPKSSNRHAISRQWEILRRLPNRAPGITARALATYLREAGYEVTKRTVERDLIELSRLFGLRCNDVSTPYGWHWLPGKQCDFGSIDLPDAVSLVLTESMLEKLLPAPLLEALRPRFALARSKLAAVENNRYTRWADKVRYVPATLGLIPPKVDAQVLAAVQQALLDERQIVVAYLAPSDRKSREIPLHPLSLIQRGPTSYLVATAYEYSEPRLYALHRIRRVALTNAKVTPPKGYSTDRYLATGAMEFGGSKKIRLKAWVNDEIGILLAETPLSDDQTIRMKQGRHPLTAEVTDSWQLRWWILSQADKIVVISPEPLRQEVAESLKSGAANY